MISWNLAEISCFLSLDLIEKWAKICISSVKAHNERFYKTWKFRTSEFGLLLSKKASLIDSQQTVSCFWWVQYFFWRKNRENLSHCGNDFGIKLQRIILQTDRLWRAIVERKYSKQNLVKCILNVGTTVLNIEEIFEGK